MRIAIIAPYARPEKGACVLRVDSFREFFEKNGFDVEIFAPARAKIQPQKNPVRYKGIFQLVSLLFRQKFDAAIGTSPPMTHSFFALLTCRMRGIPFVLDLRDPWTVAARDLGVYRKSSIKLNLYELIEKISYRLADRIFVVTEGIKNAIVRQGAPPWKITLIENGANTSLFRHDPDAGRERRKELGFSGGDVVGLYAGAFADWEADKLLMTLVPLMEKKKSLKLLFLIPMNINSAALEKIRLIVQSSEALGKAVVFVDSSGMGFEDLCSYFSAADFGITTVPEKLEYCIPVKTYDYLASELPVLAKGPGEGCLKELFEEHACGLYSATWEAFALNAEKLLAEAHLLRENGRECRFLAEKFFERSIANEKALKEIMGLAAK